ncbi:MAG TPA: acyl carrier protein [Reyranella sp.]|nr:acyl carrier protein [Reyranella sp.]
MESPSNIVPRKLESVSLQMEIFGEIRRLLAPYHNHDMPLAGDTVICDGTAVDSLTVMDMIVELEDRFDIAIPMKQVVEIRTVDQLADTILRLVMR